MSMFDSSIWKNGHSQYIACSIAMPRFGFASSHALTTLPKPYQPGSMSRHCAQLNTHGIVRRSSIPAEGFRDDGRLPMFGFGDFADHRRFAEAAVEAVGFVDEVA